MSYNLTNHNSFSSYSSGSFSDFDGDPNSVFEIELDISTPRDGSIVSGEKLVKNKSEMRKELVRTYKDLKHNGHTESIEIAMFLNDLALASFSDQAHISRIADLNIGKIERLYESTVPLGNKIQKAFTKTFWGDHPDTIAPILQKIVDELPKHKSLEATYEMNNMGATTINENARAILRTIQEHRSPIGTLFADQAYLIQNVLKRESSIENKLKLLTEPTSDQPSLLDIAAMRGDLLFLDIALNLMKQSSNKSITSLLSKNKDGLNNLHIAAANGHANYVTRILKSLENLPEGFRGNILGLLSDKGESALHMAVEAGHLDTVKAILDVCPKNVLVDLIESTNYAGYSAAMIAKSNGCQAISEELAQRVQPLSNSLASQYTSKDPIEPSRVIQKKMNKVQKSAFHFVTPMTQVKDDTLIGESVELLEGMNPTEAFHHVRNFLKETLKEGEYEPSDILRKLKFNLGRSEEFSEEVEEIGSAQNLEKKNRLLKNFALKLKNQADALQPGESMPPIPIGTPGHAMLCLVERMENKNSKAANKSFKVSIMNTGLGIDHHASMEVCGEQKYDPLYTITNVSPKRLDKNFFSKLNALQVGDPEKIEVSDIYNLVSQKLYRNGACEVRRGLEPKYFIKPQKAGTCTVKVIFSAYIKEMFLREADLGIDKGQDAYKALKVASKIYAIHQLEDSLEEFEPVRKQAANTQKYVSKLSCATRYKTDLRTRQKTIAKEMKTHILDRRKHKQKKYDQFLSENSYLKNKMDVMTLADESSPTNPLLATAENRSTEGILSRLTPKRLVPVFKKIPFRKPCLESRMLSILFPDG